MNTTQSELQLELGLITQLKKLEYDFVTIKCEDDLLKNLKTQLEIHNSKELWNKLFSEKEFEKIILHLSKGNIFEKAKTLRDKMSLEMDNGEKKYIEFINMDHWCQNEFQVTHQITMEWMYKNRYDVTLLVNGLPLVQVELKRRGLELKEAFNQTNRYDRHSFGTGYGLFQYIQVFVISNWVNTKYFANNPVKKQSFKQTFYWSDEKNNLITKLEDFTDKFLEPCHISKMITKYIVLNETDKMLMILRPYQYYATEAIVERVKKTNKNGYIWHTTWSGKTLTSFKTSQILKQLPEVKKVLFVVDRKDLDYQTQREFDAFEKGSVDATDNTSKLVKQLCGEDTLIMTTIQKLNNAVFKDKYKAKLEFLQDEKVVFIFDECHRSQFWETHSRIKKFFRNAQMFGFTGTPIFADNHNNGKTTKDLFGECLHKYVITDAIKDENVLKFSIEYINTFKKKSDFEKYTDEKVQGIDTKEVFEAPERVEKVVDYILKIHNSKTHSQYFTAMFCVSSVEMLIKYYEAFKKKKHNLKIATIFSYGANEDDKDADGIIDDVEFDVENLKVNKHSREKLDEFIVDYNKMFETNFSTKDSKVFYSYYQDIAKKVKERRIDILLVVNMFLTGFDSKTLNTMYVDKNLRYHWLIQAFSRTNRTLNELKSQGNIVCFRNLKNATDEAIALFSNPEAKEIILIKPIEQYIKEFNKVLKKLRDVAPEVDSINDISSEEQKAEFVKYFRELLRLKNVLTSFSEFTFASLEIDEQTFEDYKSKYLDIYESVKKDGDSEKVSILDDIDFEIELFQTDIINVDYILGLLGKLKGTKNEDKQKALKKEIEKLLSSDINLRSKKELVLKFIEENLPHIHDVSEIQDKFEKFMNTEKAKYFHEFCSEEWIDAEKFEAVLGSYIYTQKTPSEDLIVDTMKTKPWFFERHKIIERITAKMKKFVDMFEN